jgi:hypothetical protein
MLWRNSKGGDAEIYDWAAKLVDPYVALERQPERRRVSFSKNFWQSSRGTKQAQWTTLGVENTWEFSFLAQAHSLKVASSNLAPQPSFLNRINGLARLRRAFSFSARASLI